MNTLSSVHRTPCLETEDLLDSISRPIRFGAKFEWARDKGEARATKQAQLHSEQDTVPGFVSYLPIYTNGFLTVRLKSGRIG